MVPFIKRVSLRREQIQKEHDEIGFRNSEYKVPMKQLLGAAS